MRVLREMDADTFVACIKKVQDTRGCRCKKEAFASFIENQLSVNECKPHRKAHVYRIANKNISGYSTYLDRRYVVEPMGTFVRETPYSVYTDESPRPYTAGLWFFCKGYAEDQLDTLNHMLNVY